MMTPEHVPFYYSPLPLNGIWAAPIEICVEELKRKTASTESDFLLGTFSHDLVTSDYINPTSFYGFSDFAGTDINTRIRQECMKKLGKEPEISFNAKDADYVLYAMISAAFKYLEPFDDMEYSEFENADGATTAKVRFFGFEGHEEEPYEFTPDERHFRTFHAPPACAENVSVLYYDDVKHHAVKIYTYRGSSIVLVRSPEGESAQDIFNAAMKKASVYGDRCNPASITSTDWLSIPELEICVENDFREFTGQKIVLKDFLQGHEIKAAKQITSLKLDRKGVSFESEAGIDCCALGFPPSSRDCRFFLYDGPFAMFLIDEHSKANIENHLDNTKCKPYACFRIDDIRYFQKTPDDMK